ncbi:TPA: TIR domain-containing protein [Candidatus Poribacteria bacterium]|nr:TIR domain-containing protein [Candidatus Poribacteria bacterium]HIA65307.1 TIR domain-containing protein [Candidatus Poribacteria bacterium]HIB89321.1 TIR domain-containing protein [Candidatus Poribacteria bacterium]HIB98365.1 TIR domain-containing protein [Candidatus Poribacteria bacterium]HIN27805.1 TIR domain-containing protein [Candidatus Poribacteria bacterium]
MPNQAPQLESQRAADMVDVFISYSRKDIEFAQRLHHTLESRDHESWIDW